MAEFPSVQYFLGANAPGGFYSLYDQLLPRGEARAVYILKGGPGCGKSTLMRRVGQTMAEEGLPTETILCSGDPDSLDGLILPTLGAAIVDGTAPHVVEPRCPGAVECYVDLGEAYDRSALAPLRKELEDCMAGYPGCYRRAYGCLSAAAELRQDSRAVLLTDRLEEKLARRARGILARELRRNRKAGVGRVKQRFLSAMTHRGPLALFDTVRAQCGRVYVLEDRWGLAHQLLTHLLSGLVQAGHDVVACPDPLFPDRLLHLLAPGLGLAFVSSTAALPWEGDAYRRIRLDAAADGDLLRRSRPRLRFAAKVAQALEEEATASLAQAKAMHDRLEALYHPYVDFALVETRARRIAGELLARN